MSAHSSPRRPAVGLRFWTSGFRGLMLVSTRLKRFTMGFVRRGFCGSLLCLVALAYCQPALATSLSQAAVRISQPFPNPDDAASTAGPNVVSVSNSGVTLSAQSDIARGSVGVQVEIPTGGYDNNLSASATWSDGWTGTSLTATSPIGAVIALDGSIDTTFYNAWVAGTNWNGYFSLLFRYEVGDDQTFQVGMSADSEAPNISARFDGTDITANLIFTPDPSDPTKTRFSMSYATPVFAMASSGFFDALTLSYQSSGQPPSVDAIHTFRTQLGSPDPTVSFGSDSGRTFGIPAPEPSMAQLEAIALAGIAVVAVRRSMLSA